MKGASVVAILTIRNKNCDTSKVEKKKYEMVWSRGGVKRSEIWLKTASE